MLKYVVLILRHHVSIIKNIIHIRIKEYNKVFARKALTELSDRCFVADIKKISKIIHCLLKLRKLANGAKARQKASAD